MKTKEQPSWFYLLDFLFLYLDEALCANKNNNQCVEDLYLKAKTQLSNPWRYGFTDCRQEPLTQSRLFDGRQKGWPARKEQAGSLPLTLEKGAFILIPNSIITQNLKKSMLWHVKLSEPLISVGVLIRLFDSKQPTDTQINLTRRIYSC